ncbi:MAG: YraN family protein [Alicyclobacillaceae bacterium]|nr:YraN family protein [Alicyclobacillaceae bacterium]
MSCGSARDAGLTPDRQGTRSGRRGRLQRIGRSELGRLGEQFASEYVERSLGWTIVFRNWRCRLGELDLVCREGRQWVVVEVRTRQPGWMGPAVEAVDQRKVRQLRRVLPVWMARAGVVDDADVRVDVLALTAFDGVVQALIHLRGAVDMWS